MLLNIFCYIIFSVLSIIPNVKADFEGKLVTSNRGCSFKGLTAVTGYSANIYSYSWNDLTHYSETNFFNGQYSSNLISTASLVLDPNFVNNEGYSTTETSELWGIDVPITNFVAQLSGYFYGMFFLFTFKYFYVY